MNNCGDAFCPQHRREHSDAVAIGTRDFVVGQRPRFRTHHHRPHIRRDFDYSTDAPRQIFRRRLIFAASLRNVFVANAVFIE